MNEIEICFIFCPPLSKYPEQPKDMSLCKLEKCPDCNNEMWVSVKKKEIIKNVKDREIILLCYDCFIKFAKKNPHLFSEHMRINI